MSGKYIKTVFLKNLDILCQYLFKNRPSDQSVFSLCNFEQNICSSKTCIMEYYSSLNDDIIGHEIIEDNSIEILCTTNQLTCILFLIVFILNIIILYAVLFWNFSRTKIQKGAQQR